MVLLNGSALPLVAGRRPANGRKKKLPGGLKVPLETSALGAERLLTLGHRPFDQAQELHLLIFFEQGFEFEYMGNDHLLHFMLMGVYPGDSGFDGLVVRMFSPQESEKDSPQSIHFLSFLVKGAVERRCLLPEQFYLFRFQGQFLEKVIASLIAA
jgi:hypothetical protein